MRTVVFISCLLLFACGGSTTTDLFVDSGADGSASDAASVDGSKADAGDAGADCKDLLAKADGLRTKAAECFPPSGGVQCNKQVEDFCCPLTVTGERKEVTEFVAAVKAAKAAGCAVACPASPCAAQASLKCDPTGSCRQLP
ncbi:hypothetical protein BH09MYX1_BH09MYX1_00400 [soil metagenome]